jgi:hypothetical protein
MKLTELDRDNAAQALMADFAMFLFGYHNNGARGGVVVKALCYKPEGRAFNTL